MGELNVHSELSAKKKSEFIRHLLDDVDALQYMLDKGLIEDDITRIGAEQEFCLVNDKWRPAVNADEILEEINDDHFTNELAKFNLEINLDPIKLADDCFEQMRLQLKNLLELGRKVAEKHGSKIVLTGILPTIGKRELKMDYMTPRPRYGVLNEMLKNLRGDDFQLHLQGVDDLTISHESVLFEACNTSFQMHLQIAPNDFISSYNWSQAIAAPVLAISTNSPLLMGRELWSETRIALFRQSIDTRPSSPYLRDEPSRVSFGQKWAEGSVVDIFKESITNYRIILNSEFGKSSMKMLEDGEIPKLRALNLHNGTIYPWNRACYGVGNGKPHLRIENRYIASGPSQLDEMATFVFWVGLMIGRPKEFDDMPSQMEFRDAKSNFVKAARMGKDCILRWMNKRISAEELVLNELLPMAKAGLRKASISEETIEYYLSIIEKRTTGLTGSRWMIDTFRNLQRDHKKDSSLRLLTKQTYLNQLKNKPVHFWETNIKKDQLKLEAETVGRIMSTRMYVVNENDLAKLAVEIMKWKNIHHVPVEGKQGELKGLLTWKHVESLSGGIKQAEAQIVSNIMEKDVHFVHPETSISESIALMKKHEIGCLPVVQDGALVGIITIKDLKSFNEI